MHYFLLIHFNNKHLHVSSRLAAHHQEDQLCINSNWYSHAPEMCHPRCVYKLLGRGIKSITQQVYLVMFSRG